MQTEDHNGVKLFFNITQMIYRTSESKVEQILTKIETMNIRQIPGEDVSALKLDIDAELMELEMNINPDESVNLLMTKVMKPFNQCTDNFFGSEVK